MTNTLSGSGSFSGVGSFSAPSNAVSYTLGQTGPGGGKIFYVAPTGTTFAGGPTLNLACTYLEAAPTSGTAAWSDSGYAWSANTSTEVTTDSAIGTGYKNTLAMVSQDSTAGKAGTISRAYRGPNNNTDWFLPSKDELNQLYTNRASVGGFVGNEYWSSFEYGGWNVWFQFFDSGNQSLSSKGTITYVRPIRAF